MGKTVVNCIIIVYVVIAILVTMCLLSYNDKKVTQFGTKSLIIINKDDENFKYKKGDLVILDSENYEQAQEGDTLFFYNNDNVKIAKVRERLDYQNGVINYKVDDSSFEVIKEDIIGTSTNEKVIGKVGGFLKFLESKWGFLFLIVFPSLLAFLHEITELISEIKSKE